MKLQACTKNRTWIKDNVFNKYFFRILSSISVLLLVQACSYKNKIDSSYYCQKLKFSCTKSDKVIYFKTTKGDFEVKLFGNDNPVTVSNFLENIENNIYVNQIFYKIINYPQIRFIHGGVNPENKFYLERNQT